MSNYALRIPDSLKAAAEKYCKEDGVSLNQFINLALAEKVSALGTAQQFFNQTAKDGSPEEALSILQKSRSSLAPQNGDET